MYRAVELFQRVRDAPENFPVKAHSFKETRKRMRAGIRETLVKMEKILDDFYEEQGLALAKAIEKFGEFQTGARERG
jgi:hypothetical protein